MDFVSAVHARADVALEWPMEQRLSLTTQDIETALGFEADLDGQTEGIGAINSEVCTLLTQHTPGESCDMAMNTTRRTCGTQPLGGGRSARPSSLDHLARALQRRGGGRFGAIRGSVTGLASRTVWEMTPNSQPWTPSFRRSWRGTCSSTPAAFVLLQRARGGRGSAWKRTQPPQGRICRAPRAVPRPPMKTARLMRIR